MRVGRVAIFELNSIFLRGERDVSRRKMGQGGCWWKAPHRERDRDVGSGGATPCPGSRGGKVGIAWHHFYRLLLVCMY